MTDDSGIYGSVIKLGDVYSDEINSGTAEAALQAHEVLLQQVHERVGQL